MYDYLNHKAERIYCDLYFGLFFRVTLPPYLTNVSDTVTASIIRADGPMRHVH